MGKGMAENIIFSTDLVKQNIKNVRLQVYSQQLQADGEKRHKMDFRVVSHIEAEGGIYGTRSNV